MNDMRYGTVYDGKYIDVPTTDELCRMLHAKYDDLISRVNRLQEENKTLKDEAYKEKELVDMKTAYDRMKSDYYRGFPISEDEQTSIREWQERHMAEHHGAKTLEQKLKLGGVSGGVWTYEFVPTAIGTSGVCVCGACRRKAYEMAGDPARYKTHREYVEKVRELSKDLDSSFEFQQIG